MVRERKEMEWVKVELRGGEVMQGESRHVLSIVLLWWQAEWCETIREL